MIPRVHPRDIDATEALTEALNRPVSDHEGLTEYTVVAHWPDLDFFTPADEHKTWTSADWAEHLNDPTWQQPFTASPQDDRRAIWHADMRLHPGDRVLTGPEWSEIAYRLARAAGIHPPGDEHGCRWIAVQAQTGRLDLIANLTRPGNTWTRRPHRLVELLSDECRRVERDLGLISPLTVNPAWPPPCSAGTYVPAPPSAAAHAPSSRPAVTPRQPAEARCRGCRVSNPNQTATAAVQEAHDRPEPLIRMAR